jgi:hypothetical protein
LTDRETLEEALADIALGMHRLEFDEAEGFVASFIFAYTVDDGGSGTFSYQIRGSNETAIGLASLLKHQLLALYSEA